MSLFPPILDAQRESIPAMIGVNPPSTAQIQNFEIFTTLPQSLNVADIGNIQVLIRRQIDMEPWIAPPTHASNAPAPEGDVIYLRPSAMTAEGKITLPVRLFTAGDSVITPSSSTAEIAAQTGRFYTIQVRFGMKTGTGDNVWAGYGSSNTAFAAWKAAEIAANRFGEWSNVQRVFVYGVPSGVGANAADKIITATVVDDVIGRIEWSYGPLSHDPLALARITYSWSTPDDYGNAYRSRDIAFTPNANGGASGIIDLGVLRIVPIKVSIRLTTVNNTIFNYIFDNSPTGWTAAGEPATIYKSPIDEFSFLGFMDSGTITSFPIVGEEIDDGVIAMSFYGNFKKRVFSPNSDPRNNDTLIYYRVYRADAMTLETVALARYDGPSPHNNAGVFSEILKDYSIAMGEEYIYFAVSYGFPSQGIHYILTWSDYLDPDSWNPVLYQGYGRQMNFQGNVFLTTKFQQLKLKGNVSVSSFQRNTSDTLTTTIGSQYPFYSRAGNMNYRTLSLQGLITLQTDLTHTFLKFALQRSSDFRDQEDNLAAIYQNQVRNINTTTYPIGSIEYQRLVQEYKAQYLSSMRELYRTNLDWMSGQLWMQHGEFEDEIALRTLDLFSNTQHSSSRRRVRDQRGIENDYLRETDDEYYVVNGPRTKFDSNRRWDTTKVTESDRKDHLIYSERQFRDMVMKWLANGKPKLFRSETEGNMIVMLTGISLSPLNKSREVFSVSMTLTEIAEFNTTNLILYNLIPLSFESQYRPNFDFEFVPGGVDPNV